MTFETLLTCLRATQTAAKRTMTHKAAQSSLYRAAALEEALKGMAPWSEPVNTEEPEPAEFEQEPAPEPEPVILRPGKTLHKTNDAKQALYCRSDQDRIAAILAAFQPGEWIPAATIRDRAHVGSDRAPIILAYLVGQGLLSSERRNGRIYYNLKEQGA